MQKLKATNFEEYAKRTRDQNLRTKHRIGVDEYDAMLAAQGGVCAICGGPPVGGRWQCNIDGGIKAKHYHVDHDHATGRVRALLCGKCNRGLGDFHDNSELLAKAAKYIESFSNRKD